MGSTNWICFFVDFEFSWSW